MDENHGTEIDEQHLNSISRRIMREFDAEGKLPVNFTLEEDETPSKLNFVPGAMDGAGVHGHYTIENQKEAAAAVANFLLQFFTTGNSGDLTRAAEILKEYRAITLIDSVLKDLRVTLRSISADKVVGECLQIILYSEHMELVKVAIAMLGIFELGEMDVCVRLVSDMGVYEELTLYSVFALQSWKNGNRYVFSLAQRVHGWGKIDAVEHLEPDSDEIREWIFMHGCSNSIMDAYLGLVCARKGDLISVLRKPAISPEEYNGASIIIEALLDEGPTPGISVYEHSREAIILFLAHSINHVNTLDLLRTILSVSEWLHDQNNDDYEEPRTACLDIISKPIWKDMVISEITRNDDEVSLFVAVNVANRVGYDISQELMTAVMKSPIKMCQYSRYLFGTREAAERAVSVYEVLLPLDDMKNGMGDYLFSDFLRSEHMCLESLLQELRRYPLLGSALIETGLQSKVIRMRNYACLAISAWTAATKTPLADLSPDLYRVLEMVGAHEVYDNLKVEITRILSGA